MIVSEFFARLGVQVDRGSFAQADKRMASLGDNLRAAAGFVGGLFAVQGIKAFVHDLTAQGAALKDMSDRMGISAAALQQYGLAAKLAGSSQEGLETGLKFLAKNSVEAASGGKEMAKAFAGAGIALKGAGGESKTSEQLLGDVADAIKNTEDPSKRTALAIKLLGRSGAELIPLLKDGRDGLEAVRKEAIELGGGLSDELIKNADELDDNITRLNFSMLGLKSTLGNVLLPAIDRVVRGMIGFSKEVQRMLQTNKFIQITLFLATAALVAFGIANIWASRVAIASWLKAAAPFLAIAAIIVGIGLAIDDVHSLLTGGKSLLGKYLNEWFGIGTADAFVRDWATGVQILTEKFQGLWQTVKDVVALVMTPITAFFGKEQRDANTAAADRLSQGLRNTAGDVADGARAWVSGVFGDGGAPADRANGRGMGAGLALDPGIPRAAARGTAAALLSGSAGFDSVSVGTANTARAAISGGSTNISSTANVTVNAGAGTDPRDLERRMTRAAQGVLDQNVKNLRRAAAPKAARKAEGLE